MLSIELNRREIEYLYDMYDCKPGKINIIGVRREEGPNKWNDTIILDIPGAHTLYYQATTDPGKHYTLNPYTKKGAARLVLGYHPNIWVIGKHRGNYEALVQRGNVVTVARDSNRNFKIDDSEMLETGWFGINLHRSHANFIMKLIGKYSAGCQVILRYEDFKQFMGTVKYYANKYNQDKFSYLLVSEEDVRATGLVSLVP